MPPQLMKNAPGVLMPFLVNKPVEGYDSICLQLDHFYHPERTDWGLIFKGYTQGVPSKSGKMTWRNKVYEDKSPYANVNVQHLGTKQDPLEIFGRQEYKYGVFFNVNDQNPNQAETKSREEAVKFMQFLQDKYSHLFL